MIGVRAKYARLLAKRRLQDRITSWWIKPAADEDARRYLLGRLRKTPCPCSCQSCGNPRRHFNALTRQELQAFEASRWELEDCDEGTLLLRKPKYKHRRFDAHLGWNKIK